jgi:hypothetical protein
VKHLAVISIFLAACSSTPDTPSEYHQGVYRPATPALRPGHGAPVVGQPGVTVKALPQPAPGRLLPQTPETQRRPGIWASDIPKDLPAIPKIDGTIIPFPDGASTDEDKFLTRECSMMVDGSKGVWDPLDLRNDWTPAQRKCMAATLFHACIHRIDEINTMRRTNGELFRDVERWLPPAKASAAAFMRSSCRGVTMPPKYVEMVGASNKPIGILLLGPVQRVFK